MSDELHRVTAEGAVRLAPTRLHGVCVLVWAHLFLVSDRRHCWDSKADNPSI